jgi:hypothetical protein
MTDHFGALENPVHPAYAESFLPLKLIKDARSPPPPRRRWQTKPACLTVISCKTLRRGGRGLRASLI